MSENMEELYADLFAYRIYLQDIYHDEIYIIRKLKIKLYELGRPIATINNLIYNFYQYYQIPDITPEYIEESYVYLYINPNTNMDLITHMIRGMNMRSDDLIYTLRNLMHDSNITNEVEERAKLQETKFNELGVIKLEEDIDNDCSICIDKLTKGNDVIKLGCNHVFHYNCIKSYLLNYDNRCPLCRCQLNKSVSVEDN